jgi:hypothetical protein
VAKLMRLTKLKSLTARYADQLGAGLLWARLAPGVTSVVAAEALVVASDLRALSNNLDLWTSLWLPGSH